MAIITVQTMKGLIALIFSSCLIASALAQFNPNCFGSRKVMVHLFEWRWADIADECERFLSKKGYCGVQVSPPNENRVYMTENVTRPWWERYQPVSYKIYTRSGDETAFIDMVKRCNDVGVRIYVDAILNHMAGEDAGESVGTGGTRFNSQTLDFPGIPYSSDDFHKKGVDCLTTSGSVEIHSDAQQVRNCRLGNLPDLNQGRTHVRQRMTDWLNKLIQWGVAGFRIDSAKNMLPDDIRSIVGMLNDLSTKWFPIGTKPYIFNEVIDLGGEAVTSSEYYDIGQITEFNYGKYLSEMFSGRNHLKYLQNFGESYGYLMPDRNALVFIDNHDTQRGHGAGGHILSFWNARTYKMAVSFMLAWPYGTTRVMSSYRWERKYQSGVDQNDWVGPPSDSNWNVKPVNVTTDGLGCGNGWVCEHRWRAIVNMVGFRNVAGDEEVANWWDDGDNHIAFSRGSKAFYAVNGDKKAVSVKLQTGLAPGHYCDVISGERSPDCRSCTGKAITVNAEGMADISIPSNADEPMMAIHIDSLLGDCPPEPETTPLILSTTPSSWKRTVVFVYYSSTFGENVFFCGGLDHSRRPNCDSGKPENCWVPIRYDHISYPSNHYGSYNAWAVGDNYLNWNGAEPGQGTYQSKTAYGSPTAWTTNSPITDQAYHPLNVYGKHYWMWDVMMDCDSTESGWFEFKAVVNGRWESDVYQYSMCDGDAGAWKPFTSKNHVGKCGFKNVFKWQTPSCVISKL